MELTDAAANPCDKNERWRYPRFFAPNDGEKVFITGDDAKHISTVLRMKAEELAVICDNNGTDFLCKIVYAAKDKVELDILESKKNEAEPNVKITLFQCLPKNDKMDFIVQKATELGAYRIIPVLSRRCVSRPDEKSALKKIQRWEKIAEEASKQCGGGRIPEIGRLTDFRKAVTEYSREELGILFYECGGKNLAELPLKAAEKISIFIGSEGGFESEEVDYAVSNGVISATLGKRILRCETAPLTALSVLMNLTGNM